MQVPPGSDIFIKNSKLHSYVLLFPLIRTSWRVSGLSLWFKPLHGIFFLIVSHAFELEFSNFVSTPMVGAFHVFLLNVP